MDVVDCTAVEALAISRLAEPIVSAVFCKWWNRSDWLATRFADAIGELVYESFGQRLVG
jgi:hypothetical protein